MCYPISPYPIPGRILTRSHDVHSSDFKMASQSQGIQQLLQAEKKAETMVSEARKRKNLYLRIFTFIFVAILFENKLKSVKNFKVDG